MPTARGALGFFPPEVIVQVKALACELPATCGVPLSRWSRNELARYVQETGLVGTISGSTIWRWLSRDAIRPWQHRSWVFPRDPEFAQKAAPVLDLYQRIWEGRALHDNEFVISADEKTSIQARRRTHPTRPPEPRRAMRVEHEYERRGAWAYLAALDVHHATVVGRCETTTGIEPFHRLVDQVMASAPYRHARRVFWIVDNGSSHRGARAVQRAHTWDPRVQLVHTPCHASWLNQIEIYFSIVQRKVLTPNDFADLAAVADRLRQFERHFAQIGQPFEWTFTRDDLANFLEKLDSALADAA